MSIERFKDEIENGNFIEAFSSLVVDDVIDDELIFKLAILLENGLITSMIVVNLFLYLLEKPKLCSKVSAFRLILVAFRTNCPTLADEFFVNPVMSTIHDSLITFMPENIKKEILLLVHCWYCKYGKSPSPYPPIIDLYKIMVADGFTFPKDSLTLSPVTIPEWQDGTECSMCSAKFTTFIRKHHCRNCGCICCNSCSSSTRELPHLFIAKASRVCDRCEIKFINKTNRPGIISIIRTGTESEETLFPKSSGAVASSANPNSGVHDDDDDDPALKLALELSLKEAEEETKKQVAVQNQNKKVDKPIQKTEHTNAPISYSTESSAPTYPDLSKVFDDSPASKQPQVTQPSMAAEAFHAPSPAVTMAENDDPNVLLDSMRDLMVKANLKMRELKNMNKSVALNPYVQTTIKAIMAMYGGLTEISQKNQSEIAECELFLQKIDQIEQARASLDDMNRLHFKKLQEQRMETEYLMKIHMEQKMQFIRQQQLEFQEYQRGLDEERRRKFESEQKQITEHPTQTIYPFSPASSAQTPYYEQNVNQYQQPATTYQDQNFSGMIYPPPEQLPQNYQYNQPPHAHQPPPASYSTQAPKPDYSAKPGIQNPPYSSQQKKSPSPIIEELISFDPEN